MSELFAVEDLLMDIIATCGLLWLSRCLHSLYSVEGSLRHVSEQSLKVQSSARRAVVTRVAFFDRYRLLHDVRMLSRILKVGIVIPDLPETNPPVCRCGGRTILDWNEKYTQIRRLGSFIRIIQ